MLAVLSAIGGVLASAIPEVIKYFKDKQDKKHELEIMKLQIERDKLGHAYKMEEIAVQGDIEEAKAIYNCAVPKEGWVSGLNALVRPLITFVFFGTYVATKFATYSIMAHASVWQQALNTIWTENDFALMCAVLGFWFGNRSIKHFMNGKK